MSIVVHRERSIPTHPTQHFQSEGIFFWLTLFQKLLSLFGFIFYYDFMYLFVKQNIFILLFPHHIEAHFWTSFTNTKYIFPTFKKITFVWVDPFISISKCHKFWANPGLVFFFFFRPCHASTPWNGGRSLCGQTSA